MIRYGLDFGTTNSSIAHLVGGEPRLLKIDNKAQDPEIIRSLLYFFHRDLVVKKDKYGHQTSSYSGEFNFAFGQNALENYLHDNKNRSPGIIRQIYTGKMVSTGPGADLVAEYFEEVDFGVGRLMQALKTALKSPTYKGTNIFGKFFSLEQMISLFVSLIKQASDQTLREKVDAIKVGRPVHFLDNPAGDKKVEQRLKDSLKMVGFKQIEFEYESVAAAKYFLQKFHLQKQKILVFDFGGGTLDTAVVLYDDGFKILATDGIYIGGNLLNSDIMKLKLNDYFGSKMYWGDQRLPIAPHIFDSLNSWYGIINLNNPADMRLLDKIHYKNSDPSALERLTYLIKMNLGFEIYEAIETAKKNLSNLETTKIKFSDGPIDIDIEISRDEFENLITPRINSIKEVVIKTLKSAKTEPEEIEIVVRTGGSSLIPMVEKMLVDLFGQEKVQLFDTFTSIAAGLALE